MLWPRAHSWNQNWGVSKKYDGMRAYQEAGNVIAKRFVKAMCGAVNHDAKLRKQGVTDELIASEIAAGILDNMSGDKDFVFYECFENSEEFVFNMKTV